MEREYSNLEPLITRLIKLHKNADSISIEELTRIAREEGYKVNLSTGIKKLIV